MDQWVKFFFGTPKKFFTTTAVASVGFAIWQPDVAQAGIQRALYAMLSGIDPFFEPLLTLALVVIVMGWLWRNVFGKK